MVRFVAAVFTFVFSSAGFAATETWEIDGSHSRAGFKVKHMMVSNVHGEFSKLSGALEMDGDKGVINATAEVASVDTNEPDRDKHLRSEDFFDEKKFPKMTFSSTQFAKQKDGKWTLEGKLTIKDTTKPVKLQVTEFTPEVKDPWGGIRRGLAVTGTINRKDFGITWSKTMDGGGLVVGDEVTLNIDLELKKAKKKQS